MTILGLERYMNLSLRKLSLSIIVFVLEAPLVQ